jgi:hypothetical protein
MVGNARLLAFHLLCGTIPSLAGSRERYQTAWRLQGRSFVPRSLPFRRQAVWFFRPRATREGGRPSVERECQASGLTRDTVPARGTDLLRLQREFIGVDGALA